MPTPATSPRSQFVTVLAWLSIAMAVLGVVGGLLQAVMLAVSGLDPQTFTQLAQADGAVVLPPALEWAFGHLQFLNLLSMLSSVVLGVIAWGLLQRREWGRLGFIALLLLSAALGVAGAFAFADLIDWAQAQSGVDPALADPLIAQMQALMKTAMYGGTLIIAVLHAGIAWKLHTPAVRAEFATPPRQG